MKRKLASVLLSTVVAASLLAGCGGNETSSETSGSEKTAKEETSDKTYPELDLNPTEALSVSTEGIQAAAPSAFTLTDEDIQKLKDGKYKAAFCYHTQSDTCNQTKLANAKKMLEDWGIETVSVTDANFDAATQTSQIRKYYGPKARCSFCYAL